jgi:hypothetical protein
MEQTVSYRGYTIEITRDQDPLNPRKDWEHLGEMVCWHSNYLLGDEQPDDEPIDWLETALEIDDDVSEEKQESMTQKEYVDWLFSEFGKNNYFMMLHLYDHGGISMSCKSFIGRVPHASWDSGRVGFIYVSKEDAKEALKGYSKSWLKEYHKGKTEEEIVNTILEGEVETYNEYLTGEVYCYSVDETGDGCCGFFGDEGIKQAIEDAKSNIDYNIDRFTKRHIERVKAWIRNRVPFYARKPLEI